jgi:hypothetical protein
MDLAGSLLCSPASKHHELHQEEVTHRRTWDREELGDQHVRSERREAELNDHDRNEPAVQYHEAILNELPGVVFTAAAEHPEFVQRKMAHHGDKIRYGHCYQRGQKTAKDGHATKINDRHSSANRSKPQESKNPVSIEHVRFEHILYVHCASS